MSQALDNLTEALKRANELLQTLPDEDKSELTVNLMNDALKASEHAREAELLAMEAIRKAKEADEVNASLYSEE